MFNRRTNVALAGKDGNMVSGFLAINYITCYPSVKYKTGRACRRKASYTLYLLK